MYHLARTMSSLAPALALNIGRQNLWTDISYKGRCHHTAFFFFCKCRRRRERVFERHHHWIDLQVLHGTFGHVQLSHPSAEKTFDNGST